MQSVPSESSISHFGAAVTRCSAHQFQAQCPAGCSGCLVRPDQRTSAGGQGDPETSTQSARGECLKHSVLWKFLTCLNFWRSLNYRQAAATVMTCVSKLDALLTRHHYCRQTLYCKQFGLQVSGGHMSHYTLLLIQLHQPYWMLSLYEQVLSSLQYFFSAWQQGPTVSHEMLHLKLF